jgi:hypothetical protein
VLPAPAPLSLPEPLIPWLDRLVLLGLSLEPALEPVLGAGGLAADGPEPLVLPLFVDDVPVPVPPPVAPVPPLPLIPLALVPPMPPASPEPPPAPWRKPLGQMRLSSS